jgi:hypothetical protein
MPETFGAYAILQSEVAIVNGMLGMQHARLLTLLVKAFSPGR